MKPNKSDKYSLKKSSRTRPLLYDARGVRIKASPLSNKWVRALIFYVLPYIVINGIIFLLVCSSPSVTINVQETSDYVSSDVEFTVKSILPLRDLTVTLESEPLEYEKSGNTYTCNVSQNGTFMVQATSINGMLGREFVDVGLLDDSAPNVNASSAEITGGVLTFVITDNQSGVDYDSVYLVTDSGETILPSQIDKTLGSVSAEIPGDVNFIDLYYSDMVGNEGSAHINVT